MWRGLTAKGYSMTTKVEIDHDANVIDAVHSSQAVRIHVQIRQVFTMMEVQLLRVRARDESEKDAF